MSYHLRQNGLFAEARDLNHGGAVPLVAHETCANAPASLAADDGGAFARMQGGAHCATSAESHAHRRPAAMWLTID